MRQLFLARPTINYKTSYIAAIREYHQDGLTPTWNYDVLDTRFEEYVTLLLEREHDPAPGYVPQTDYWLIVAGEYAGDINLRHRLTTELERFGGHIGYRIRPTLRHKGYGTLQLRLVLPKAWALGLSRVLITCDDDNSGSIKIIESNGGILQDKVDNGRGVPTRRYWIARQVGSKE